MGFAFYAVNPYFILSYSRVLPLISCSSSGELGCPLITVAPRGEDLGRMGEMATGAETDSSIYLSPLQETDNNNINNWINWINQGNWKLPSNGLQKLTIIGKQTFSAPVLVCHTSKNCTWANTKSVVLWQHYKYYSVIHLLWWILWNVICGGNTDNQDNHPANIPCLPPLSPIQLLVPRTVLDYHFQGDNSSQEPLTRNLTNFFLQRAFYFFKRA